MQKLNRIQRLILKDLFRARGMLDSYSLYQRYYITPSQLATSTSKFVEAGYLSIEKGRLSLTPNGRRWLVTEGFVKTLEDNKPWRRVPEEFVEAKLPAWLPYIPEIGLLDKSFAEKQNDGAE